MDREGRPHDGSAIAWEGRDRFFIDTKKFTGKSMMAYGQTAITEDLYATRDAAGGQIIDEASNVQLHELTTGRAYATYEKNGQTYRVDCDYIAGCDGYHGVSRHSISGSLLRTFEKGYPFGWLGIMSETPPFPELCYCYHRRGFALASMRSPMLSRYEFAGKSRVDRHRLVNDTLAAELKGQVHALAIQAYAPGEEMR
jgi:p-hydroxybenzoate 3-monooxygenase